MSTRGKGRLTRHTPSGSTGDDEMGLAAADAVFRTYQDFFFQYSTDCCAQGQHLLVASRRDVAHCLLGAQD